MVGWDSLLVGKQYPDIASSVLWGLETYEDMVRVRQVIPDAFSAPDKQITRGINRLKLVEELTKTTFDDVDEPHALFEVPVEEEEECFVCSVSHYCFATVLLCLYDLYR